MRQIDNFMFFCKLESTIREVIAGVGMKVKIVVESGSVEPYNGIDFLQT